MKTLTLFAVLITLVGCGDHGTSSLDVSSPQNKVVVQSEIPASQEFPIPKDAQVDLGAGRYIKLIEKNSLMYAGVVFPEGTLPSDKVEKIRPGEGMKVARMHLQKHFPGPWSTEGVEEKNGYTVFMFRYPTKEEVEEARKYLTP